MQMDSTTPPDSVFHLFVLLCALIVSCQFAHAFPITDRTKYIYLFIYFVAVSYNIHAYTILHGLRPISYDVPI